MLGMGHPDPRFCAEFAKEFHKADARILDFGCGTGLVGEELVKAGFDPKNIWGIDASQGMLDVTAKKNCYSELIHMFLGQPATFREDLFNKFDVVTAAGILAEGHLMSEVFDEMLHALK
jgi:predicted TPR repeat methyltransferase